MAIRKIITWPNFVLDQVSGSVNGPNEEAVHELITDMFDTMRAGGGIGLAAIQVGVAQRLFVMDVPGEWGAPHVLINPVIKEFIGEEYLIEEGCLSVPGYREKTMRYAQVIAEYTNENGVPRRRDFYGLEAQVVQHEMEHLDGKIFLGTVGSVKRDIIKRKIAKAIRQRGR